MDWRDRIFEKVKMDDLGGGVELGRKVDNSGVSACLFYPENNILVTGGSSSSNDVLITDLNFEKEGVGIAVHGSVSSLLKWDDDIIICSDRKGNLHFISLFKKKKLRTTKIKGRNFSILQIDRLSSDEILLLIRGTNDLCVFSYSGNKVVRKIEVFEKSRINIHYDSTFVKSLTYENTYFIACTDSREDNHAINSVNHKKNEITKTFKHMKHWINGMCSYIDKLSKEEILIGGGHEKVLFFINTVNGSLIRKTNTTYSIQAMTVIGRRYLLVGARYSGVYDLYDILNLSNVEVKVLPSLFRKKKIHGGSSEEIKVLSTTRNEARLICCGKEAIFVKLKNLEIEKKDEMETIDLMERVEYLWNQFEEKDDVEEINVIIVGSSIIVFKWLLFL